MESADFVNWTRAVTVFHGDKTRQIYSMPVLYYGGGPDPHVGRYDANLCLATLRPDGFAGYQPKEKSTVGVVTTRPVTCSGAQLRITADAKGGAVRIRVLAGKGK